MLLALEETTVVSRALLQVQVSEVAVAELPRIGSRGCRVLYPEAERARWEDEV